MTTNVWLKQASKPTHTHHSSSSQHPGQPSVSSQTAYVAVNVTLWSPETGSHLCATFNQDTLCGASWYDFWQLSDRSHL